MSELIKDFKIDNNLSASITLTCPACGKTFKKNLRNLSSGTKIKCSCGSTINISGNELSGFQRELDSLNRTLKNFGK